MPMSFVEDEEGDEDEVEDEEEEEYEVKDEVEDEEGKQNIHVAAQYLGR